MAEIVDYPVAVDRIATVLGERDHYVVITPPACVALLAPRLAVLPSGWSAYLAARTRAVLVVHHPESMLFAALSLPGEIATVVTIPKTVPVATLSEAFSHEIGDGSRDVIMLTGPKDEPIEWPMLFVQALERVDPASAAQLHSHAAEYRNNPTTGGTQHNADD